MNKGLFTSKSYEWGTPQKLYDELNKEFNFKLDPCCSKKSRKCEFYFYKKENGLKHQWDGFGSVFMNPPYGNQIKYWIEKAYNESKKGCIIVGLLPTRTDTKWFHDYIYNKAEIRFLKGRLKFESFGKNKSCKYFNNAAPFPSMIVVWNNNK